MTTDRLALALSIAALAVATLTLIAVVLTLLGPQCRISQTQAVDSHVGESVHISIEVTP